MCWERFNGKIKEDSLALAAGQLAAVLSAKMPLTDAVALLAPVTSDRRIRRVLENCSRLLYSGSTLSEAFALQKGLPVVWVEAVRIGEETGRLAPAFGYLADYYRRRSRVKKKVRAATRYPAFLCVLTLVVLRIVMTSLLPAVTAVFSAFDAELPAPTRALAALSRFFSSPWICLLPVAPAVIILLYFLIKTDRSAVAAATWRLRLPFFGRIALLTAAGQFSDTVSLLLGSGLSLPEAMRVTVRSIDDPTVRSAAATVSAKIEAGEQLGSAMRDCGCFPSILCEMAAIGEATGTLQTTMSAAGAYCYEEASAKSERLLSMLEPALIVLVGALVAFVVISVFLPLFSMYDAIGSSIR